jgi:hypothetical protein
MGDRQQEIDQGLYEKWARWIERIYKEVVTLFAFRMFYRGVTEMTQANDEIPPIVLLRRPRRVVRDDAGDGGTQADRLWRRCHPLGEASEEHGRAPPGDES